MHQLLESIGREHESDALNRRLRDFATAQRAAAVGAMLVTCADECEIEQADSFQHWVADGLLPELKTWRKAPFRVANLGARYEWGAIPVAEHHYALPETREDFKVMIVKLNSHVCVDGQHNRPVFGTMNRYSVPSTFCGALHAMMDGRHGPALDDLRRAFASEGKPRLAILNDIEQTDPHHRALLAAVVNARLQARRAVVDIQHHKPHSPTYFIVLATVTLNRHLRDTELVVGFYLADLRQTSMNIQYYGLEDDPSKYEVSLDHTRIQVSDDSVRQPRAARNHGEEVLNLWIQRRQRDDLLQNAQLQDIIARATSRRRDDPQLACEILSTLGWLLFDVAPIPTSIVLFAKGAAGAHHLYTVHQLARGNEDVPGARRIVNEFLEKIDNLPPDQADTLIDALLHYHRPGDHAPPS
jgi:hypothetical protein